LAAIWAAPHDDLPRLVYADRLEESGIPERVDQARFIRIQCEVNSLGPDAEAPELSHLSKELTRLRKRLVEVLTVPPPKSAVKYGYERGLPKGRIRSTPVRRFMKWRGQDLFHAPVWEISLRFEGTRGEEEFAQSPLLAKCDRLTMNGVINDEVALALARSTHSRTIRVLSLNFAALAATTFRLLWANGRWDGLQELLFQVPITEPDAIALLVTHGISLQLQHLHVGNEQGHPLDLSPLHSPNTYPKLKILSLADRRLVDTDSVQLCSPQADRALRQLHFHFSPRLGDGFATTLSDSVHMGRLLRLSLASSSLSPEGASRIASSDHLCRLQHLNVSFTPAAADSKTRDLLKKRFGKGLVANYYISGGPIDQLRTVAPTADPM
jgi:uncharacterized protein (TIGR02996 family)